jgi:hypothetical protein
MKKIDLTQISRKIKTLDIEEQKETKGTAWIDTVDVIEDYPSYDDGPWDNWDRFWDDYNNDLDSHGGSGSGSNSGNGDNGSDGQDSTPGENINDQYNAINSTKNYCTSQIATLKSILSNSNLANMHEGAKEAIKVLETTLETIEKMENSNLKFRTEIKSDNGDGKNDADVMYDSQTGEYVIAAETFEGKPGLQVLAHEIEHIAQHLDGELNINNYNGYDRQDEIDAYTAGHYARYGYMAEYYDIEGNFIAEGGYEITWDEIIKMDPSYEQVTEGNNNNNNASASASASASN